MEIASKIMTLIDLSNEHLVIVSPYVNFKRWDKMKSCLRRAIDRGVKLEFYIRENVDTDMEQFLELNIKPIRKENLHAKLYYNEQYGIVTSQNMIRYSDDYSIDIGYQTESREELSQLEDFRQRYLNNGANKSTTEMTKVTMSQQTKEDTSTTTNDLDKNEVDKLCRALERAYPGISFTPTSTYIYSSGLLGWPDAMIGSTFTIKFGHNNALCKRIKNIDTSNYSSALRKNIKTSHKHNTYIDFIPTTSLTVEELVKAYHSLIIDVRAAVELTNSEKPARRNGWF